MSNIETKKPVMYYHDIRLDIIEFIKEGPNRILEIGCGSGNTGAKLKELGKASAVWGIELNPEMAREAEKKLDKVICCNIEVISLAQELDKSSFDYIILADILEHLYNPWRLVAALPDFLEPNGFIISSLPNVRFWKVLKGVLINKSWEYQADGVMDNTHIRFFAKKNMIQLFESGNFRVEQIVPKFKFNRKNKYNTLNKFTLTLFEDFITRQYVLKIRRM